MRRDRIQRVSMYKQNRYCDVCEPIVDDDGPYPVRQTTTIGALQGFSDTTDKTVPIRVRITTSSILKHSQSYEREQRTNSLMSETKGWSRNNYTPATVGQKDKDEGGIAPKLIYNSCTYKRYLHKLYFIFTTCFNIKCRHSSNMPHVGWFSTLFITQIFYIQSFYAGLVYQHLSILPIYKFKLSYLYNVVFLRI